MSTVTKKELIERIADAEGCKRAQVKRIVQLFLNTIVDELGQGNRLEFREFGVFECRIRAPRLAQNPKTMDKVEVPSRRTVKFKPGRTMKARLEENPIAVDQATGLQIGSPASRNKNAPAVAVAPAVVQPAKGRKRG